MRKLIDDCFIQDSQRITHDDALAVLQQRIAPVVGTEIVPLMAASGRVLAKAAIATQPVPAHTNSAVDGYSFAEADALMAAQDGLPIGGRAAAGHALAGTPSPQTAIRIFTGAVLPQGHNTVAMQEDCHRFELNGVVRVEIPLGLKRGANVRNAGEDLALGSTVVTLGTKLRPQDIAALASIGLDKVNVYKRLQIGLLSSGDEVVSPGQALLPGQVYDANAPMLHGLATALGCSVSQIGIVSDDAVVVEKQLADAARKFDLLLTTGGASQGEEDHIVRALDRLGKRHLWQLAIKPGRPMSFGQIGDCVVVGLPGNPVAVFVCFLMYVAPMLLRLSGAPWWAPKRYMLPAAFEVKKRKLGRREFWRGMLRETPTGLTVDKFARDGSGLISGLRAASGLIEVLEMDGSVQRGDRVRFIPFSEFGF